MSSIRVLILSNNHALHMGLKKILEANNIEIVSQASSSEDIAPIAYRVEPNVMLLDIDEIAEDAVAAAVQRLRPEQAAVLVMSRHNDAKQIQRLLEAGALGYADE